MSESSVDTHDEVEYILHTLEDVLSVVNVNVEFTLDSVMHKDTGP